MQNLFQCHVCSRTFDSFSGLGVHKQWHKSNPVQKKLDRGPETRDMDFTDHIGVSDHMGGADHTENADCVENPELLLSEIYLDHQVIFMEMIYGEEALYSKTWKEYSEHVKQSRAAYNPKRRKAAMKIYECFKKTALTNLEAEYHLNLHHELVDIQGCKYSSSMEDHHSDIPTSWEQVKSIVELSGTTVVNEEVVPWPASWRMDKWNTTLSVAPKCVSLILLDPIQLIAQQFLNPEIVYGYQHHIKFTYKAEYINGEQVYADLTSSNWFRDTESSIRETTGNPRAEVLPISLYSDGVEVGPNRSVMSVLGTCGLYSDELQRKNLAKFCLGYIKELDNVPLSTVETHLRTKAGYTATGAADAVKEFKNTINQIFWAALTTSIKVHHRNGIKMRVLCDEKVHEMYPVLSFVIGDEPAQHAVTSVKQNNTKRPCNQCTYCPDDRVDYTEVAFPYRNNNEMKELCPIAVEGNLRLQNHKLSLNLCTKKNMKTHLRRSEDALTEVESAALRRLKDLSVHPRINPFHDVPMGSNNDIYCIPNDPFHVYCAGLMKSCVKWILLIVTNIDRLDKNYCDASALLDGRLDSFPYCPELPHVPPTYFRNGLTHCVNNVSKKEKENATGSLGGYRSSHYITALLHLYFAIGYNGDILPNDSFEADGIQYGNPTAKVFNSILSMLDVFFQCKQSHFSAKQIKKLEVDIRSSNAHFHVLWELKQAIVGAKKTVVLAMKKPHMQFHFPRAIEYWGCLSKTNTERFEAAHHAMTKRVYDGTTKKKDSTVSEMTLIGINNTIGDHLKHLTGIQEKGHEYLDNLLPKDREFLSYSAASQVKKRDITYDNTKAEFHLTILRAVGTRNRYWNKNSAALKSNKSNQIATLASLLPNDMITKVRFDKILIDWFTLDNSLTRLNRLGFQMFLIGGITILGNKESGIEKVHIYATSAFQGSRRASISSRPKHRYDFVEIKMEFGEPQLAQVLAFLEIQQSGEETKFIAVVAYLVPEISNKNLAAKNMKNESIPFMKSKKHAAAFFRRYMYAYISHSTLQIEVIGADTIIGSAFVVKDFYSVQKSNKSHHRFNYVPRHFTDRSGWDPTESELTRHNLNVENTSAFIRNGVSTYDAGFITHDAEEFRKAIGLEADEDDGEIADDRREKSKKRKRGRKDGVVVQRRNYDYEMDLDESPMLEFDD